MKEERTLAETTRRVELEKMGLPIISDHQPGLAEIPLQRIWIDNVANRAYLKDRDDTLYWWTVTQITP